MNKVMDKLFKGIDYFTGILTGLMVCLSFECRTPNFL